MNLSDLTDSINKLLAGGAGAYATVKQADALNHPQLAPNGVTYQQGQFGVNAQINPMYLLIGAGLLMVVFLKS